MIGKEDDFTTASKPGIKNYSAPVKAEYLVKNPENHGIKNHSSCDKGSPADQFNAHEYDDQNYISEHLDDKLQPPSAKKAKRGMNKSRPRDPKPNPKSILCPSYLDNRCRFGDNCKFSHDLVSFWALKPADLGEICPIFDSYGFCKYGITCRYARSHVDDHLNNLKLKNECSYGEINKLDLDLKVTLQKRKYNFDTSETLRKCLLKDNVELTRTEKRAPKKLTGDDFKNKLYLAPLTTVGNLPFRRICLSYGAEITCGEMALATELLQGNQSEWALLRRHPSEKIFGVQICGGYPDTVTKCAQVLAEKCEFDFIDLNVGCPIDLICEKGAGCSLMNKPKRLEQICRCLDQVLGDRALTLKMRTGVHMSKNTAHSLIANLRDWNVTLCTVHGRSREQRYTKLSDWSYVNLCAKAGQPVPIFGSGDILSFEDYYNRLEENSDISGIMIARGALIKPWIFTEIKERRHWDIRSSERLNILKEYVKYGLEHWGSDQRGVDTTRRFLLEWLSFAYRYIPVGLLERLPQRMNERPPPYVGRDDLETLMASNNCKDWVKISEMLLGPVSDNFRFLPKHKANAYEG